MKTEEEKKATAAAAVKEKEAAPPLFIPVVRINSATKVIQANESTKEMRTITSYTSICFVPLLACFHCVYVCVSSNGNQRQELKSQEMNKIIIIFYVIRASNKFS